MMVRVLMCVVLVALVAVPVALRPARDASASGVRRLVVITPHGEPIRAEFGAAFAAWARAERGLAVELDWRTPGGTAEITRYLDGRYAAAFAEAHPEHAAERRAAMSPKPAPEATAAAQAARAAFLASNVSVDIDLVFGGGEFPFRQYAAKGYVVDAGILADPAMASIPPTLSGELMVDPQGRYVGACLAVFGIAASPDRLAELGFVAPVQWAELAEPRYRGRLTIADPTKSGAVVTAMERIIQQAMAEHDPDLAAGWALGLERIRRMVANARVVTDSASKPTRDVVRGDAVASMAIDFQARAEAEWSAEESGGPERLVFTAPAGGTSVSADPIALLRGAPERDLAVDFMRFVLSSAGQRLWGYRAGTPGGPQHYTLHRMPVRRDVLDADWRRFAADPTADPFTLATTFTYRPAWTASLYPLIGPLVKAIALDPRDELVAAWTAIDRAGGPAAVPAATAALSWLPFTYADAMAQRDALGLGSTRALPLQRAWTVGAQAAYREATRLAEAGR
jgi:ABC-type Fe3+ transport system substrate-binding protein